MVARSRASSLSASVRKACANLVLLRFVWHLQLFLRNQLLGDTLECLDTLLARDLGHFDNPLGSRLPS